jgi:hypothetical protein
MNCRNYRIVRQENWRWQHKEYNFIHIDKVPELHLHYHHLTLLFQDWIELRIYKLDSIV